MLRVDQLFNEKSHLNEEGIALYVDAMMLEKIYHLPSSMLEHVADCKECKTEVVETFFLVENQEYHSKGTHPYLSKNFIAREKRFLLSYRIAAVVAVGIGIGIIFYLLLIMTNFRRDSNGLTGKSESHSTLERSRESKGDTLIDQKNLFAENFSVSSNLENLVNAEVRSTAIKVLSPGVDEVVGQQIRFEWKREGSEPVILKIVSNKEIVVYSAVAERSWVLFQRKLQPGLYYWKIEGKNELLFVGKFRVNRRG